MEIYDSPDKEIKIVIFKKNLQGTRKHRKAIQ